MHWLLWMCRSVLCVCVLSWFDVDFAKQQQRVTSVLVAVSCCCCWVSRQMTQLLTPRPFSSLFSLTPFCFSSLHMRTCTAVAVTRANTSHPHPLPRALHLPLPPLPPWAITVSADVSVCVSRQFHILPSLPGLHSRKPEWRQSDEYPPTLARAHTHRLSFCLTTYLSVCCRMTELNPAATETLVEVYLQRSKAVKSTSPIT